MTRGQPKIVFLPYFSPWCVGALLYEPAALFTAPIHSLLPMTTIATDSSKNEHGTQAPGEKCGMLVYVATIHVFTH